MIHFFYMYDGSRIRTNIWVEDDRHGDPRNLHKAPSGSLFAADESVVEFFYKRNFPNLKSFDVQICP